MKYLFGKLVVSPLIITATLLLLTTIVWAGWSRSSFWELKDVEPGDVCKDKIRIGLATDKNFGPGSGPYTLRFYDAVWEIDSDPNEANFIGEFDEFELDSYPPGNSNECTNFAGGASNIGYCTIETFPRPGDSWPNNLPEGKKLYLQLLEGNSPVQNGNPAHPQTTSDPYVFTVEDCSPPTPPEVNLAQTGPNTTASIVTDALVFQVEAHDPGVGNNDGDGINKVDMRVLDSGGQEVRQKTENNAKYCVFGGGEPNCTIWHFANNNYKWPNGTLIKNGNHTLEATAQSNSGASTLKTYPIQIQLPIDGSWVQIGQNSTAATVTEALVGQVAAYVGAEVDGKDVDRVVITLFDPDNQVAHSRTENNQPYCLFGGSSSCPIWNFADHDYEWPSGQSIQHGAHKLRAEIFADDPGDPDQRSKIVEFAFNIQMPSIMTNLAQTGPGTTNPIVVNALVFQLEAYIGTGNSDGTNINNVNLRLIDGAGSQLYQRTDNNPKYCLFGGGAPNCAAWVFADNDYKWPNDQLIKNGKHTLRATVNTKDGRSETVNYSIDINNPNLEEQTFPLFVPIIIK